MDHPCRLAPDSPLLQPEASRRVFDDPASYVFLQRMNDLRELGVSDVFHHSCTTTDDLFTKRPIHSVLAQEEVDALLTPAGTVWYLRQALELPEWEASRLYDAGQPWPLRSNEDGMQWADEYLHAEQVDYLHRLFQPVDRHTQIMIELENNGWEAPDQPEGGSVKHVRAYWKHLAKETGEDIRVIRRAALALYNYYQCLHSYAKQQRMEKWRLSDAGGYPLVP